MLSVGSVFNKWRMCVGSYKLQPQQSRAAAAGLVQGSRHGAGQQAWCRAEWGSRAGQQSKAAGQGSPARRRSREVEQGSRAAQWSREAKEGSTARKQSRKAKWGTGAAKPKHSEHGKEIEWGSRDEQRSKVPTYEKLHRGEQLPKTDVDFLESLGHLFKSVDFLHDRLSENVHDVLQYR